MAGVLDGAAKVYAGDGNRITVHNDRSPYGSVYIELRDDGGYYSVVTAFKGSKPKGELIWSGRSGSLSTSAQVARSQSPATTLQSSTNLPARDEQQVKGEPSKSNLSLATLAAQISSNSVPQRNEQDNDRVDFSLATPAAAEAMQSIRDRYATFNDTRKTFNGWWHKTVGTQYHKAQVDADYKRVFDRSQQYLTDVSRYALAAADNAQDILPRFEKMSDLAKTGASPRELAPVAEAIFTGTLTDERVYTDAELRDKYRLNPKQVSLYRQARQAIERSLDDMAITDMVKVARSDISEEVCSPTRWERRSASCSMQARTPHVKRVIVTGNLLAAQSQLKSRRIINFKVLGSGIHQGVLMPELFNFDSSVEFQS